jgi:hypothetical protein
VCEWNLGALVVVDHANHNHLDHVRLQNLLLVLLFMVLGFGLRVEGTASVCSCLGAFEVRGLGVRVQD